ncbi:zinc-finger domain-containing protein [Oryzomicrobium sp.]|uniref:zinc-finger domain-containing protein n=1 Tax=Oryzomicrobium sp. TaxID=1911578 RepID=UPI0025E8AB87|nr:zinc-finger domain-containing protein [Oryzomicrobium sp.]MCE1244481.1 zinc-finger domain-containing protein [Oryzomicrobium sp.]
MSEAKDVQAPESRTIEITAGDLPLHCPQPGAPLWARHPRVFLDVTKTGEVTCPYCSAHYVLTGELPKGHH